MNTIHSKVRSALSLLIVASLAAVSSAAEPVRIVLWDEGAQGIPIAATEHSPVMFMYQPPADETTRAAVVVCPGGGYRHLAIDHEGHQLGEWFNSFGVTAFVLQYRHRGTGHGHPVPMMDGQRAIRTVRARAAEWDVDPDRVGVMGFSAGGHLASTLGTQFDAGQPDAADPVECFSSRPDFLILCYPVISMTADYMHRGSRDNLLGPDADESLARSLSSELQVTPETPPTFLLQTDEDQAVPAENAVAFYLALRRAGVPAEMHIYQNGRHGLGMARGVPAVSSWTDRCREWMEVRGLLQLPQ